MARSTISHRWAAVLAAGSALALGGCVAGVASSAVGMAVRSARGEPQSNAGLAPAARDACSAHAAQYGAVHIIDVEQRTPSKLIVWGTVGEQQSKRSFECSFGTRINDFTLRTIATRS